MSTFSEDDSLNSRFTSELNAFLEKRGHRVKTWKDRYFSFLPQQRVLKYFTDATKTTQKGEYFVKDDSKVSIVKGGVDGRPFTLSLFTDDEDNYISTKDERTLHTWFEAIQESISGGPMISQPAIWRAPFTAKYPITVQFSDRSAQQNGPGRVATLPAAATSAPPIISFNLPNNNQYYTILIISPDFVDSNDSRSTSNIVLWQSCNVRGNQAASGYEVAPYAPCAPVYGRKMRLYTLVFRQPSFYDDAKLAMIGELYQHTRIGHDTAHITRTGGISDSPIAIARYFVSWDNSCPIAHRNLNYCPPYVCRSPLEQIELQRSVVNKDGFVDVMDTTDFEPNTSLLINYEGIPGTHPRLFGIDNGATLEPEQVLNAPEVTFNASNPQDLYMLVMTDPDAPSRAKPSFREFIHWVVCNIPGGDVKRGDTILPYLGAAPPFQSGFHRYMFLLYRQEAALTESEINASQLHLQNRGGIDSHSWVKSVGITTPPAAVHFFQGTWSAYVDEIHKQMGFMPPKEYRSPNQLLETGSNDEPEEKATHDAHHHKVDAHELEVHHVAAERFLTSHFTNHEELIIARSFVEGVVVNKKEKNDFSMKARYIWIDPVTKTLNWAKVKAGSSSDDYKSDTTAFKSAAISSAPSADDYSSSTKILKIQTASGYTDIKLIDDGKTNTDKQMTVLMKLLSSTVRP